MVAMIIFPFARRFIDRTCSAPNRRRRLRIRHQPQLGRGDGFGSGRRLPMPIENCRIAAIRKSGLMPGAEAAIRAIAVPCYNTSWRGPNYWRSAMKYVALLSAVFASSLASANAAEVQPGAAIPDRPTNNVEMIFAVDAAQECY